MPIDTPRGLEATILKRATELATWLPRARTFTNHGDGLRSPNLDGQPHATGGHTDPTGDTACAATTGRDATTWDHIDTRLRAILGDLDRLVSEAHQLLPAPHANGTTTGGDHGCSSCRRAGLFTSTEPGRTLCRWCRRWRDAHAGRLPAIEFVIDHAAGLSITAARVEEVAAAARRRKATKAGRR